RVARVAEILAELDNAYWPDQYANPDGVRGHYELTGGELVESLDRLDYLFVGIGSGATIAGLSQRVTRAFSDVTVVAVDVEGSVILGGPPQRRLIPGIGSSIRPPLIDRRVITDSGLVPERAEVAGCHALRRDPDMRAGGSTGCVSPAISRYFEGYDGLPPVVAFLCADRGEPYLDTIYAPEWVATHLGRPSPRPRAAGQPA